MSSRFFLVVPVGAALEWQEQVFQVTFHINIGDPRW